MTQFPRITVGLGKLTPEVWDRGASLLEEFSRTQQNAPGMPRSPGLGPKYHQSPIFLAAITGYSSRLYGLGGANMSGGCGSTESCGPWWYSWEEVAVNASNFWNGSWKNNWSTFGYGYPEGTAAEPRAISTDRKNKDTSIGRTSTIESDPFGFPAINLWEGFPGSTDTATSPFFMGYNLTAFPEIQNVKVLPVRGDVDAPGQTDEVWVWGGVSKVVVRMQFIPVRTNHLDEQGNPIPGADGGGYSLLPVFEYPNPISFECAEPQP